MTIQPSYTINVREITPFPEAVFEVKVSGNTTTIHTVRLSKPYWEQMTAGKLTPEELIKKSFDFLLKREPQESILETFHLPEIQNYFPEYEDKMRK